MKEVQSLNMEKTGHCQLTTEIKLQLGLLKSNIQNSSLKRLKTYNYSSVKSAALKKTFRWQRCFFLLPAYNWEQKYNTA